MRCGRKAKRETINGTRWGVDIPRGHKVIGTTIERINDHNPAYDNRRGILSWAIGLLVEDCIIKNNNEGVVSMKVYYNQVVKVYETYLSQNEGIDIRSMAGAVIKQLNNTIE